MSQPTNGKSPPRTFYSDGDRHKLRSLKHDPMAETRARFRELFSDIQFAKDNGTCIAEILRVLKDLEVDIVRGTFDRWYEAESAARFSPTSSDNVK